MSRHAQRIETYEELNAEFADFEAQVRMMCEAERAVNVMVVSGDPGIGKSHRAKPILEEMKHAGKINYVYLQGQITPVQLYIKMWENPDAIFLLDDVNSIITDPKVGASLLKACTDTIPERIISWNSRNPLCVKVSKYDCQNNIEIKEKMEEIVETLDRKGLTSAHEAGETFPDMFYFTGALIILTNKSLSAIDKATEGAVSNRGYHQEIKLTLGGSLEYLKKFGPNVNKANMVTILPETSKTVIEYMTSEEAVKYYRAHGKKPSLRNLGKMCAEFQAKGPDALNIRTLSHLIETSEQE